MNQLSYSRRTRRVLAFGAVAILPLAVACGADDDAADYPTRGVTMVVPWPAGSASDVAIRLISSYAEDELGHPITHQNIEGGSGATAWQHVSDSSNDGYTIGFFTSGILANEALGQSPLSYQDYEWVMQFGVQSHGLYVGPDAGYETLEEFIEAAQDAPGTIYVGVESLGGNFHQGAGLFAEAADIDVEFVPLGGSADMNTALLGGHVDAIFNTITLPAQYVERGDMVFLASSSTERLADYPDVPTMQELGYDVVHTGWRAIAFPQETPEELRDALNEAFTTAYEDPEFQEAAAQADIELEYRDGAELTEWLDEQYPNTEDALRAIGMIE